MPRFTLRLLLVLLVVSGAQLSARTYDETRDPWIRGVFTGLSPRPERASEPEAWRAAIDLVGRTPGAFILVGGGRSMQPLYPPGTLLVIRETPYTDLRPGQTVVYRNKNYRAVGHTLVTKARDGWRVRGLNNQIHDMEPVVADNLIGVIIAAYTPLPQPERRASIAQKRRASGTANFLSDRER